MKLTPELLADLRKKAEAADVAAQTDVDALAAHSDFGRVATPQAVLAFLDRIDALENACRRLAHFRCDDEKQSDPDPLRPVCGKCVVCESRKVLLQG